MEFTDFREEEVSMPESEPLEGFSQRLKELRLKRSWSQSQLGKKLGGDVQRISKYEQGLTRPPPDVMAKLAQIFEVSLDYLMCGKHESSINQLKNKHLLKQLESLNELSEDDQGIVAILIESFIKRRKFDELMQS